MLQRSTILQTLETRVGTPTAPLEADAPGRRRARAAVSSRQKVQSFLEMVRTQEQLCWDEFVEEFRKNYYDVFDEIIPPLFATDDVLIIHNCIRFADLSEPKEVEFLTKFIQECDAEKHQVSLRELAETQQPDLMAALQRKEKLPESVQEVLA